MLQFLLDQEVIEMLPMSKAAMDAARGFERNQMRCKIVAMANNSRKALSDMTEKELAKFDGSIVELFKFKEWVKA